MKKHLFLYALMIGLTISLACNKSDDDPQPEPSGEVLTTADFNWTDAGLARVEDLDPLDLDAPTPTHVNYATAILNTDLAEVQFGNKTFFQLNPDDPSDVLVGLVFNLYSPITVAGGTAADNLLGTANERTFEMETFNTPGQVVSDYFFVEGSLSILDRTDAENIRAFVFTEGTVTVSGTAPNFTLSFDVSLYDDIRDISGTFTGTISPTFRIIENR